jgi:hypothetical protein
MPIALAKARDAGVDPKKIWKWMRIHRSLFDDAINIAMSNHAEVHICENDLDDCYSLFREALKLPPHLLVNDHIKNK